MSAAPLPAFSSTLSVNEFALTSKLQLRPLGQVMGVCVHQVGYQYVPWSSWGGEQLMCELDTVSQAWEEARRHALDRMTEEAVKASADAVVGVSVRRGMYDWAEGAVEFVVNGTAVRLPNSKGDRWPLLSDLSGEDYWKLYQAGYGPAGLVASTAALFVSPSSGMQMQRFITAYQNQELSEFTAGFYAARELALRRLSSQADAAHAEGIVGVQINQHAAFHSFKEGGGLGGGGLGGGLGGGGNERHGLVITMQAMGTAIRRLQDVPEYAPQTAIDLSA
jgi:uncharacterized protein YbjQ (UPF0145 family)